MAVSDSDELILGQLSEHEIDVSVNMQGTCLRRHERQENFFSLVAPYVSRLQVARDPMRPESHERSL